MKTQTQRRKELIADQPDHPMNVIDNETLNAAITTAIALARENNGGKFYLTDAFIVLFGSLHVHKYRDVTLRTSVKRRIYNYMAKTNYPVVVRTRYTVIWDVS